MAEKNDTGKPIVNPDYVQRIYRMCQEMEVELDENPLDFGPTRINQKIHAVRQHLNTVERESLEASRRLHSIKEAYRAAQKGYKLEEDKLLVNDPDVRAGRSLDDRKAVARLKLPDLVDELVWMEQGIEDLETVLGALKYKQNGLRNVQIQLKEQRNLCNEEISLGATWRKKDVPAPNLKPGQGQKTIAATVADETERILADLANGEIDLEADTEEESEESGDDSDEKVESVPGTPDDLPEAEANGSEESPSEDLLPTDVQPDPSEQVDSNEVDILSFLDSPDIENPKPNDTDAAETEELDIDNLLDGLV